MAYTEKYTIRRVADPKDRNPYNGFKKLLYEISEESKRSRASHEGSTDPETLGRHMKKKLNTFCSDGVDGTGMGHC